MVKISVIVPVYNGEKTIGRCVKSILNQSFSDIELIVVNDGSTDNTLSILNGIQDSRLKIITVPNGGQGLARNKGIDISEGEYLSFVDADDTIDKKMLETMYVSAKKEQADVVQCNLYDIYPNGEKRVQLAAADETAAVNDKGKYMDTYFTPCIHSYEVCNKLIRKSALDGLRFQDTRKYFSEDLLFNLELISRIKKITFISSPFYNYYQSETSHLHKNAEKRLKGLTELFRFFISGADEEIRNAACYTASMILSYSAGACAYTDTAGEMLKSSEFNGYLNTALKRGIKRKHRIFLSALRFAPLYFKRKLCRMYGNRW